MKHVLVSGHGGYILCLFLHPMHRDEFVKDTEHAIAIEPFEKWDNA